MSRLGTKERVFWMTKDIETGSGVCGLVLEEETADETIAHIYDPHGREERTDRRAHGEADFRTVAEFVYNAMGDMIERRTYTNATDYVTE